MSDSRRGRYVALFAAESRSLLTGGRKSLAAWQADPADLAPAEELFRVLHTIKGMAASLEFENLVAEVHDAETGLTEVRQGERQADGGWLSSLEGILDRIAVSCELLVEQEAGVDPTASPKEETGRPSVVQVDLARLDALLEDLGTLLTSRQELERHANLDPLAPVARSAMAMSHRLDALQQSIVHARLAPLGEVLERIPPLVRELARKLGKEVVVTVAGEKLEVDRGILGVLHEPILHLLRNAVDHGLERPEERRNVGKRAIGSISVRARQERDAVIVELSDDGRGINRAAIAHKARQQGILDDGAELTDDGILAVLSRPGFSTVEEVTDVSGRGVGMDTAVSRLHEVGAGISMATVEGKGTVFTVRLPTRLGIVPSLITVIGNDRYVMPLTNVSELVSWSEEISREEDGRLVMDVHGETVPVVDLRRLLMQRDGEPPRHRPAVVLDAGGSRVALLADQVHGQVDAVIQPMERPLGLPRWITGATVLDDGQPALLLDLASVA